MFHVDEEKCTGCEICLDSCPTGAISMIEHKAQIKVNKCTDCGECSRICPQEAIYSDKIPQQDFIPDQSQNFPNSDIGRKTGIGQGFGQAMGRGLGRGIGRGLGRGTGRGLGRGPRDGRGGGRGGGGKRR